MRGAGKSAFSFSPGFNRVVAPSALISPNRFNGFLAATTKRFFLWGGFSPVTRLKPGVNEKPDCVRLCSNASSVATDRTESGSDRIIEWV